MIRFMLGLILVVGAAGGLEQDTATISETLMLAVGCGKSNQQRIGRLNQMRG